MIVQGGSILLGNGGAKLDRQIRDAAGRIEHASIDERAGGARIEASTARSALLKRLCIRLEIEGRDDLRKKEPGAMLRVDETGVLSDPPETRVLSVDAFLNRARVHVCAGVEGSRRCRSHPCEERVETRLQNVVIVVAERIASNDCI